MPGGISREIKLYMVYFQDTFCPHYPPMIHRHFQEPIRHLIFENIEQPIPASAQIEDGRNPESLKPYFGKEIADPIKEYKKIEKRIEIALDKLRKCGEMLKKFKKGKGLEDAKRLYEQAKKNVAGIMKNFPDLDLNRGNLYDTDNNVNDGIWDIWRRRDQLKMEALKAAGVVSSAERIDMDIDPMIVLETVKKMRVVGMSDEGAMRLIRRVCRKRKWEKIHEAIACMEKGKSLNIEPEEAAVLWLHNISLEEVRPLIQAGITKDMYRIYSTLFEDYWNEKKNFKEYAEAMKVLGKTEKESKKTYEDNKSKKWEFVQVMKAIDEYGDVYRLHNEMKKNKKTPAELLRRIEEMKKAGIEEGLAGILSASLGIEKPKYEAIKKLMALTTEIRLKNEEIVILSNLDGDIDTTIFTLKELQKNGADDPSFIFIALYNSTNTKKGETISECYDLVKKFGIKDQREIYDLFKAKADLDFSNRDIDNAMRDMKMLGITEGYVDLLYVIGKTYGYTKEEYIKMKVFISDLRRLGVERNMYGILWREVPSRLDVEKTIEFKKKHPELMDKISIKAPENASRDEISDSQRWSSINKIRFAKWYTGQSPEMQAFASAMIKRLYYTDFSNIMGFVSDPSIQISLEVYKNSDTKNVEGALRFGRSLYYQGLKALPDKATLEMKMKKFNEVQAAADNIKIFEGRNVVFLANGERWDGNDWGFKKGEARFDNEERKNALEKSIGTSGSKSFIAPASESPTVDDLQGVKNNALERIITTPPPMTFMFDGHGGQDKLYINNGKIIGTKPEGKDIDSISAKELAGAISKRKEKFPKEALARDIYIYACCFNHNFMRNVYAEIKALGGVAPIAIGESEYGQYGFSDMDKFKNMYKFGELGTTIGSIRENEEKYMSSNFTIYVPDENGDIFQVVMGEKDTDNNIKS